MIPLRSAAVTIAAPNTTCPPVIPCAGVAALYPIDTSAKINYREEAASFQFKLNAEKSLIA